MTTSETITATSNKSKKTFTLRTYSESGKLTAKYRTYPMSKQEFEDEQMNTSNDWKQFLKTNNYYAVC